MKIQITESDIHRMVKECIVKLAESRKINLHNNPDVYRPIIIQNILAKHPEFEGDEDRAWAYYKANHQKKREGDTTGRRSRRREEAAAKQIARETEKADKLKEYQRQQAEYAEANAIDTSFLEDLIQKFFPDQPQHEKWGSFFDENKYFTTGGRVLADKDIIVDRVDLEPGEDLITRYLQSIDDVHKKISAFRDAYMEDQARKKTWDLGGESGHNMRGSDDYRDSYETETHPDIGSRYFISFKPETAVADMKRSFGEKISCITGWIVVMYIDQHSTPQYYVYFAFDPDTMEAYNKEQADINREARAAYYPGAYNGD